MALVCCFVSPHLFISVTCNSDWPELNEAAHTTYNYESSIKHLLQNCHNLVAPIVKFKFHDFIDALDTRHIFGKGLIYIFT